MTYEFHTQPFPHQKETFENSKDLSAYAILWEQGCGKTKLAIDNACYLFEKGEINAVLVVAPSGVHRNWLTDELPTHVPTRLRSQIRARVWESSKAKQVGFKANLQELLKEGGFSWLFISYDGFMTETGKTFVWNFLKKRKCFYVIDEAHNIKTPGAKRTKSIVASSKYAPYKRILTGTPVAQGPFDIYSQLKFLDDDFWKSHGFSNYSTFKFHFGEWWTRQQSVQNVGFDPGYDKLLRYRNIDQLQKILASASSRITKDTAGLNLPPKLYTQRYYELIPEQRRVYNQLVSEFVAVLENGQVVEANLAITRLLRLQQIICGYVQTDAEEPIQQIGDKNPRLDCLEEIISGLYQPAIIWARFTKDIDQIMDLLGNKAVRYDGKLTEDEAAESKRRFQAGEVQFFVGNPQKGKEGITLIQAKTVIYYSNSFKLIDRLQSEDRAHRIGQNDAVTYIDITAPKTVDEHIVKALRNKFDIATQITGDQLKDWL